MTTLDALEKSIESSEPIELYKFQLGTEEFFFNTTEDEITIGADKYKPLEGLSRGKVVQGAEQAKRSLKIKMPAGTPFAQKYIGIVPGERGEFTLLRFQRNEVPAFDTQVLLFTGRVHTVDFPDDGENAQIIVKSLEAALGRNMPRSTYMSMCNAFLYDKFCGANPANFNHIGVVTLVSGRDITVTGAAASGFNFKSGYAQPTAENDFRLILAQSGDVLTLQLPFKNTPLGANLQAFAGCDHLIRGDCATVFDRVRFFKGFAFVPDRNPFESGLEAP